MDIDDYGNLNPYCTTCKGLAFDEFTYTSDHEYILEGCQEGLTPPKKIQE